MLLAAVLLIYRARTNLAVWTRFGQRRAAAGYKCKSALLYSTQILVIYRKHGAGPYFACCSRLYFLYIERALTLQFGRVSARGVLLPATRASARYYIVHTYLRYAASMAPVRILLAARGGVANIPSAQ